MIVKAIPNFLTLLNLSAGFIGIVFLFDNNLTAAAYLIWVAMIFDFLDGFSARLLQAKSELGKQLDSLADLVSFGVLPALIMYFILRQNQVSSWISYAPILIGIASALRLAKFNIDNKQTDSFLGVPTPANALMISSFPFLVNNDNWQFLFTQNALLITTLILSILLLVRLPIIGLKFKDFSWYNNWDRYLLLMVSIVTLIILHIAAIPVIFVSLILVSLISTTIHKKNS